MRFNPPPNWPPAPPGWVPDSDWVPDPSWGPPPPGWQFWVPESVPDATSQAPHASQVPPGYPPQHPPYPIPYPEPGQSPDRGPQKALWITLAVAIAVAVVVVATVAGLAGRLIVAGDEDENPSGKPDITALTAEMLVGKSAFPESARGRWVSGINDSGRGQSDMPNLTIEPEECADLYGDAKAASQTAAVTVSGLQSGTLRSMGVRLALTPERPEMKAYLDKCQSFTQSFEVSGHKVTTDVRLDPLDADGVPPWAVATVMTSSSSKAIRLPVSITTAAVSGYYRGVLVVASSNEIHLRPRSDTAVDPATANDLVDLFNAEIEKLEAAP